MNYKNQKLAILLASLVALPGAAATHDGDPIPDNTELVFCNDPTVLFALTTLQGFAGTCNEDDYHHFVFAVADAGPTTCQEFACHRELLALARTQRYAGLDIDPVPLPPEEVQSQTVSTPPAPLPVALILDPEDPEGLCVVVLPEAEVERVCIDLGPVLGPLVRGNLPIEQVDEQSHTTDPIPEGVAGSTPEQRIPAMSVEFSIGIDWAEDHLNRQIRTNQADSWLPVDILNPEEVAWWMENGSSTALVFNASVFQDGQASAGSDELDYVPTTFQIEVPYAGQAVAAAARTLDV